MPTRLLADNWTFQNAGEFICQGLDGDTAHELVIPEQGDGFHYQEVSSDVLRFDALCQVLNHLVLSDEVWVDEESLWTWEEFEPILLAKKNRVVVPKAFREFTVEWIPTRELIADHLCVNEAMLKTHQENKRLWVESQTNVDEMLAALIWGGAGMLARSDYFKLPYAPHPLRQKLIARAKFMRKPDAGAALVDFVETERMKIRHHLGDVGFVGHIHLPPIVVEVIRESNDLSDLVATALQLRDGYKNVREWMGELQGDLSSEKTQEQLVHRKRLMSISRHLDSLSSLTPPGDTTVQFGFGWLKLGGKIGSPINSLKNRFGMRTEVNRLVLAPSGIDAIDKLLVMLGQQHTRHGKLFKDELARRSAMPTID